MIEYGKKSSTKDVEQYQENVEDSSKICLKYQIHILNV